MKFKSLSLAALACMLPLTGHAEMSKADVEKIVQEYLVSHPELLIEMSNALRAKQAAEQEKADADLIERNAKQLFKQAADPVGGNPKGTLTIVEFFDYNCTYCKRAHPVLQQVVTEDQQIRYIYKEFPILTETSRLAARVALAVHLVQPDKYEALHDALMTHGGPLKQESDIEAIATKLGIDWKKVSAKLEDPAIEQQLKDNYALAQTLGVTGTPAFVIGNSILRGAPRSAEDVKSLIQASRKP